MSPRIFAGGIGTETNVFSPMPTGLQDFAVAHPGDSPEAREQVNFGSSFRRYAERAEANGCEMVQGTYAFAIPAGMTSRKTYETLRDRILGELKAALPVDGVLLTLHGAMVADGYEDCETDLVQSVRELAGDAATIGILLDLHCDLPDELVVACNVIITFKEYPHVDVDERATELADLVIGACLGRIRPVMATYDCRVVGLYPTTREPMNGFVETLRAAEREQGVLSVSLGHGFPWGDAPAMAARVLVVTDGDPEKAHRLAEKLGSAFFALRHEVTLRPLTMNEAFDRALSLPASGGPVVVADVADNSGGGAPSDSTFALRELLDRKVKNAGVAMFWDPIAVQLAFAAGVGATLTLRLGGKLGPASGDPLDLTVTVRGLVADLIQRWPQAKGYAEISVGDAACLTCEGIDIIVGSKRRQVFGTELFTSFGIDPRDRHLVVVKSMNHFYAAYGPIAQEVIYMGAPGALDFDVRNIEYRRLSTNQFPWVDDPWAT